MVMSCDAARFVELSVNATGSSQELRIAHTVEATLDGDDAAEDAEENEDARMQGAADGASVPCTGHCDPRAHTQPPLHAPFIDRVLVATIISTNTKHEVKRNVG
eukprot:COSAG01_NODE_246_length_20450_cov_195.166822_10_plen_104_part_00